MAADPGSVLYEKLAGCEELLHFDSPPGEILATSHNGAEKR